MNIVKKWGIGDKVQNETGFPLDGSVKYDHIEALAGSDIDNHISIRRSVRNLVENDELLGGVVQALNNSVTINNDGIFQNYLKSFQLRPNDDVVYVEYQGDPKAYIRLRSGLVRVDGKVTILKPNVSIAERLIEKIYNLDTWHPVPEGCEIVYNEPSDKFQARIRKRNGSGVLITYDFLGGPDWGDFDTSGYQSGIALFKDISEHPILGPNFLNRVAALDAINLETVLELPITDTLNVFIGFDSNAEPVIDVTAPDFPIYNITGDTLAEGSLVLTDLREFFNFATPDNIPGTIVARDSSGGISIGDSIIDGDVTITGNLTVQGTETILNTETLAVEDNLIVVNSGMTAAPPAGFRSGIQVIRGTSPTYEFVFNEDTQTFSVGEVGDLQPVATREVTPINGGYAIWNDVLKRLDTTTTVAPENLVAPIGEPSSIQNGDIWIE